MKTYYETRSTQWEEMLKKQLFQESVDEYFRRQPLDESQRDNLKKCLQTSRYSRLTYSRTSDQLLDECLLIDNAAATTTNESIASTSSMRTNDFEFSTTSGGGGGGGGASMDDLNRAFEIFEKSTTNLEKFIKKADKE